MSVPNLTPEQWLMLMKSKDSKIRELENQLKSANARIKELEKKKGKGKRNEEEEIQVTGKDITFALNEPLDTAQIESFNASLGSFKYSKPRPSEFKLKFPRAEVRKTSSLGPERRSLATAGNQGPKLDELIFSKNVDKRTWSNTVRTLRGDPKLMGQVIKTKGAENSEVQPNPDKFESRARSKQQENNPEPKPFTTSIDRKWQEVDWSQTVLDTYASRNLLEFNFLRDIRIFSPYEVEDLLQERPNYENYEASFTKGIRTLDKLSQELMLPKSSFVIPVKSPENLEILLKECNKLFRARALVIRILTLIHKREDLLLKIMRFDEEDDELYEFYEKFSGISQDILQSIGFLSQSGLYLAEFIYLGGNYAQKVLQDEANILELFPGLKRSGEA